MLPSLVEYVPMKKIYHGALQEIEKKLRDDIAFARRDDIFHPVVVLVPSNLAGVHLRRSLACSGGSFCRVRFLTPADLASMLAENNPDYSLHHREMPPFGEKWLVALTAYEAAGGYFGPVTGRPGFSEALLQTFQELEEAGLEQVPLAPGGDENRIAELQRLYRRYRELRRPFINREAAFTAAARLDRHPFFTIALYGIYRLSLPEKKLLSALAERNPVAVYWQESAIKFAAVKHLQRWFQQQGFTGERLPSRQDHSSNLASLQKHLFQPSHGETDPQNGDGSLEFICAPDEVGEVEEITREMIALARGGVRFGEMAVVLPQAGYAGMFAEKLAAAGIPYYLAGGLPLSRTRAGRSFLLLLEMIGSDYPRQKVMELFTYAPFDYRRVLKITSGSSANPVLWDHLTLQAGVIRGRRHWRETLVRFKQRLQRQAAADEEAGADEVAVRAREQLLQLEALLDFLELFFKMLHRFAGCRSWTDLTAAAEEPVGRLFYSGEEQQALLQLFKMLRRLDECGGEFALKPALELLRSSLQVATLPRGKFQHEGINLLPLSSAAALSFPVLFLPGLAEKIAPAPARPDPLLPELERIALSGELPLRRHKLDWEALLFTLAVGGAVQKAVLTWPRASAAGGREQLPSYFLSRCGEALCALRLGHDQLSRLPGYRYIAADSVRKNIANPISAVEYDLNCRSSLPREHLLEYYRLLSPGLSDLMAADLSRFHRRWTTYDGIFTRSDPKNLLAAHLARFDGTVSATALEDYARCPYSYFLKRLLGLSLLEEPETVLSVAPPERGRLLHRVLELFYSRAAGQGLLPVELYPEKCRSLMSLVCREQFDRVPAQERPPFSFLWQVQRRSFEETLQALLEWEIEAADGFVPTGFEVPFGSTGAAGTGELPVTLDLNSGKTLFFQGRIDRIDRRQGQVRVIDYKTGRKKFKDESMAGGEALQLPVYLLAAQRIFKPDEPEAAAAYAYHLSPQGVRTVLFSGDSWPEKEQLLGEAVEIIDEGIARGRYFPYPNPACRYCNYAEICGPDIDRIYRCKAADPILSSFLKLKEAFV